MNQKHLSIVCPVYNEEEGIVAFYDRITAVCAKLDFQIELIFVDDGSKDASLSRLQAFRQKDPRVKILKFSRNFGHQAAVKAGVDYASGDAVVIIDTDLQDPPEAILEMVQKWQQGFDVVYAVRESRKGESWFKLATAHVFYRFLNQMASVDIPLDTGDFRLISRKVAYALKQIKERRLYLRGLVSWLGFSQTSVLIHRNPRQTGTTKYPLRKMLTFAWNGVAHFSFIPLQVATYLGMLTLGVSFVLALWTLYIALILKIAVSGWASLMIVMLFLGSIQLMVMGILGSYIARSYDEVRGRPLYLIDTEEGF